MSTYLPTDDTRILTYNVLGCTIHAVTASRLTDLVDNAVTSGEPCIVANHNLHSLYLYQRDAKVRELFSRAKWIHADGMGVVFLGRATGAKLERSFRVTYADWLPALIERAAIRKWRVFYLGSQPGVADRGAKILGGRFPGLTMTTAHGYFDQQGTENEKILEEIRAFEPDVLLVGMGMPRQEHWINDNVGRLGSIVMLPCGAAMDYVAGAVPTPPRWAGRLGLEWLYRLAAEPGRLWKRYLVEPWLLIAIWVTRSARFRLRRN
jgi:N-acetylglucosaminyldiphosphoundecaprenol N-acetyl-beta-D-mannosaminyltransferase